MMGIDLGTEFFKVTVIKPGKPFMMLENLLSKTKTELAVGLKEDEITYAYDALAKKAKAPANIFNYFQNFKEEDIMILLLKNIWKIFSNHIIYQQTMKQKQ